MSYRAVVVDDHHLIRDGLRRAFDADSSFEVVGEAATVAEALARTAALEPDLLVVDVNLPDGSGIEIVKAARAESESVAIVVLTMHDDEELLLEALEAGASAFASKNSSTDEVVNAARHAINAPQTFTAKGLAKAMQNRMAKQREVQLFTDREREVLLLLAEGKSTSEVSKCLFVSVSTAKTHISKVYQKLGVHTRSQALMEALRLGLLPQGTSVS